MRLKICLVNAIFYAFCLAVNAQNNLHWQLTNEFPGGAKTGIAKSGDSLVIVSLKNGAIRSTDQGNSFQQVLSSGRTYCIFTDSKGVIYIGGKGCVYISANGGADWDSATFNTIVPIKQLFEHPDGGIFAITHFLNEELEYVGDGVFFSSDNGQTWNKRNNGLNNFTVSERIAIDRYGRLYLAIADEKITGDGGLFISDDVGNTWFRVPIEIDGKGAINNYPKIQFTHGLSVSADDTVYLSFEGTSGGAYVILNLKIAVNDLKVNKKWQIYQVDTQKNWFMDTPLQNQFIASNNSVFSSSTGVISQGKSYMKYSNEDYWNFYDAGLGVSESGFREPQHFIEINNIILMVQEYDERIYWMKLDDNDMSAPIEEIKETKLWPNPVKQGGEIYLSGNFENEKLYIAVATLDGKVIFEDYDFVNKNCIQAPIRKGVYILTIRHQGYLQSHPIIVY